MRTNRGFSVVEILLSSAILVIIFALGAPVTLDFYQSQLLTSERDKLIGIIKRARTLSLANKNKSAHGVYIDNNQYLLFEGSSYAARNTAYDEFFTHSSALVFSGVSEIIFAPLSGDAASTSLNGNIGPKSITISTNSEGGIIW